MAPPLTLPTTGCSDTNKKRKPKSNNKAKGRPLQNGASLFFLEGVVRGRDAHEQGVAAGVFVAVVHEVG